MANLFYSVDSLIAVVADTGDEPKFTASLWVLLYMKISYTNIRTNRLKICLLLTFLEKEGIAINFFVS
jgi:hypothetical protein